MQFLLLPLTILLWFTGTSLAQSDNFYDLDFDDTLHAREPTLAAGYETEFYKRSAEAMLDVLTNFAENPDLSRREARNSMSEAAEAARSTIDLISVLKNGCPSRANPDYLRCRYCRDQKKEQDQKRKQKRAPEPRGGGGGGRGGRGGRGGGGRGGGKKGGGRITFDCTGWKP